MVTQDPNVGEASDVELFGAPHRHFDGVFGGIVFLGQALRLVNLERLVNGPVLNVSGEGFWLVSVTGDSSNEAVSHQSSS